MALDITSFFSDYGVRFITEGSKHCQAGWVQTECPFCSGNKGYHLGYSLRDDYFNCWRCGFHPSFEVIKALTFLNWDKVKEVAKEYYTGSTGNGLPEKIKHKAEKVVYPTGTGEMTEYQMRYLERRGYDAEKVEEDWDLLGTGPIGSYKHRIIAPIKYNEILVSYQGRDQTDKSTLKYKACPQELERIDHKKILYGLDKAKGDSVVLVEGITDVWRLGPGSVASFGIKTKASQILLLAEKFRKVFIMYDDDPQAIVEAEKIGSDLSMCGVPIVEICLIDGDPGNMEQSEADEIMKELIG